MYTFSTKKTYHILMVMHNIIKQCAFVHVGLENITMQCPNLMQGDSNSYVGPHEQTNIA